MTSKSTGLTALALSLVICTPLLTACTDDDAAVSTTPVVQPGRPGEDATVLPPGTTFTPQDDEWDAADVAFVSGMIPHHLQAVTMAQLAPGRASNPTVVGLASRIEDVQGAEVDVYRRWLQERGLGEDGRPAEHGGSDHGTDHGPGHEGDGSTTHGMASQDELDRLEDASGEQFDRLWLELMIRHHEGALQMAEDREVAGGLDVRASELAADAAVTQLDEINRMKGVLESL